MDSNSSSTVEIISDIAVKVETAIRAKQSTLTPERAAQLTSITKRFRELVSRGVIRPATYQTVDATQILRDFTTTAD